MAIRTLSLCSGIGGLELGLSLVARTRTVCYVERDAYAAACLVARMEDETLDSAPIWSDLVTFDAAAWRGCVDLVTAGFPCQPHSLAGKRRGLADDRWIWPDIVRIIREVEPSIVMLENVPGLASSGGLAAVLGSLAVLGLDAEWGCFRAADVGAPHIRKRLFILAYSRCVGQDRRESGGAQGRIGKVQPTLAEMGKTWPTPTAGDSKASGAAGYSTEGGRHAGTTLTDAAVRGHGARQRQPTGQRADPTSSKKASRPSRPRRCEQPSDGQRHAQETARDEQHRTDKGGLPSRTRRDAGMGRSSTRGS